MRKAIFTLAALAALVACSKVEKPGAAPETYSQDEATLLVNIHYGKSGTKALGGNENATESEGKVNKADFYFYDKDGNYVARGTHNVGWDAKGTENPGIESEKASVVTITGLKSKTQITQMLCILNRPSDYTFTQKNLSEVNNEILTSALAISSESDGYLMTSSAYQDGDPNKWFVCTVPITEDNFLQEAPPYEDITDEEYKDKAVQIYVERVAVKVGLGLGFPRDSIKGTYKIGETSYNVYQIPDPEGTSGFPVDRGTEHLYLAITGWGLNATLKSYYPFKKLFQYSSYLKDSRYNYFDGWNDSNNKRSYWEESPFYGATKNVGPGENAVEKNKDNYDLKYITYNEANKEDGVADYCTPNTFKPWWISKKGAPSGETIPELTATWNSAATCALVQSILLMGEYDEETGELIPDSFQPATLYRGEGVLRTEANHLSYVIAAHQDLVPWKLIESATEETPAVYAQAEVGDFMVEETGRANTYNIGDGYCGIKINITPSGSEARNWYSLDYDEEGQPVFEPMDALTEETSKIFIVDNEDLSKTEVFNAGMMYYSIPIEHNLDPESTTRHWYDVNSAPLVGDYGVVRNHFYNLTVKSVAGLGHGVYDPDVVIVPNDNVTSFYLGADIHVVSWKYVSQDVNLK